MDGNGRLALAKRLWDWEPHPGQRDFLTFSPEPKVLVAACGRRWGKTAGLSVDVACRVLMEPDLAQLLVGPTKDQADGLFDAVDDLLQEIIGDKERAGEFPHLADLEIKRSPYCHIRRKSDSQVILSARSAGRNGRNLRGKGTTRKMKRFRVVVDEAAYVPDVAIDEALRPMLATVKGGGQLVMISSPNGKRGAFYEAFLRGERQEKGARSVRLPSSGNPLVDPEYLADQRERLTDRQFRAEYLAEFVDAAGQMFGDADIDTALCDDDYGPAPLWGVQYVAGIDFGRRRDWTVCFILAVSPFGVRVVDFVRVQGLGWRSQVVELCKVIKRWGCVALSCDATGNGDAVSSDLILELAAERVPCEVEQFLFSASSKGVLMDGLAVALASERVKFPAHPVLISELRNFEATPSNTLGGREKMEARTGHDDCVCALALAIRAAAPWLVQNANAVRGQSWSVLAVKKADKETLEWSAKSQTAYHKRGISSGANLRSRLLMFAYRSEVGRQVGAFLRRTL